MKTSLQILDAAEALLMKPNGWARRGLAHNRQGFRVSPLSEDAVSFDVAGAVIAAAGGHRSPELLGARLALWYAARRIPGPFDFGEVEKWNDDPHRTKLDIAVLFRAAKAVMSDELKAEDLLNIDIKRAA